MYHTVMCHQLALIVDLNMASSAGVGSALAVRTELLVVLKEVDNATTQSASLHLDPFGHSKEKKTQRGASVVVK